jgi:ABC-type uncharacterized transport system ATPase subunit
LRTLDLVRTIEGDPLRLLILDDVLIGLDLNNRLPLLELLRTKFPRHQILLLTHDLVWFDIAREHNRLSHSGSSSLTSIELNTALQTIRALRNSKIPFKP